ncbi:glycosyltransferase family 4 protein [Thermomonas sp.]|uniref:glycosyltransferase family 4 protein n=1 Tax=Thermomonas sp. TaxID=1971895 RepID=UPI0024887A66|nr:glycosyltransferase family 4 protein [Thermomonas sp.]MDI1253506.1 glycosyltransferase family 4 protein [Thermomonas sp.]
MSGKLDILVGADVLPDANSGAAGTVMDTSHALAKLGHRVDSFWADSLGRKVSHGNLHYILELPRAYRREVAARLARRGYDVVQLSQPYSYLSGRMVLGLPNRPLMVWRSHGLEAKVDAAMLRYAPTTSSTVRGAFRALVGHRLHWIQREAMHCSDGAIVPCADDKKFLVEQFGAQPDRVAVIWHGVPDAYLDAPVSTDERRWKRLLHVSQMSANKGPMIMNRVVAQVLQSRTDVCMTWICPQPLHDALLSALPDGVRDRVDLRGWVDRSSLMEMYDTHGIFLFPTLAEGAAKVVMEAMARGMCVVSSDTSGPTDYIRDGANGRLVPVGDVSAMALSAADLASDAEMCSRLGHSARVTAAEFRWGRCASAMTAFYDHLNSIRRY